MDMRSYKLLVPVLFLLFAITANAQTNDEIKAQAWLKDITHNAVSPVAKQAYAKAPYGFALYFSKAGNIDVPYLVYVPRSYNHSVPTSVVVFLHGAILAKDSFQYKDPAIANEPIFSVAEMYHTIVVFPFGRSGMMWPSQTPALENIVSVIKQVEVNYNVDQKKVYLGGISMGGISTFWFINHKPDMFAGFYTFSAMPKLPGEAVKFSNITKEKPLYSMNATDDQGFPYTEVQGIYEQHKSEALGWNFGTAEKGGHRFIYGYGGAKYVQQLVGKLLMPAAVK
jgi:predicted peptidase